ncbi:hypothetical protein BXY66_2403 [Shimia isoporae]|uniref:DUF6473 domain-containing protein n=2 Tax=Shimia isoporae TaxID=647720 RepID=A0A4R1N3I1_9RHOB|nr:hypothetical protein BXY66_2403 [Shimia isoporae]
MDAGEIDYAPCRYGKSRIAFRGPKKTLDDAYVAFIGGTETYGKFVPMPFVNQVEAETGTECVNLGCVNAGIDAFLAEPSVLDVAQHADATVIQIMGAQNMSNRYYKVHPRRNDRFIGASQMMQLVFNEVDFSEFHFTRHMLQTLLTRAPERYAMVREELRMAWSARMKLLLNTIGGRVVLLWVAEHSPDDEAATTELGRDPLFIDRGMLDELRPLVDEIVEVVVTPEEAEEAFEEMVCSEMEQVAAKQMLGPKVHEQTAKALSRVLQELV